MSNPFLPREDSDVADLVRANPLCWLVSGTADERFATPLPLLPETEGHGAVTSLLGHFGRSNPHVAALQASPHATILSMGANGYITPRLVSKRGWGPTWNYAVTRFEVEVRFVPEENDGARPSRISSKGRADQGIACNSGCGAMITEPGRFCAAR